MSVIDRLMREKSITSSEILLKARAKAKGVSFSEYSVPKIVIIAMKSEVKTLANLIKAHQVDWSSTTLQKGEIFNKKVGLVPLTVGAPATAMLAEDLIACGAETILLSTALGTFQPFIMAGDFVIPNKVVIGEGTSKYYFPRRRVAKPHRSIIKALKNACESIGVKPFVGAIWNTDAFYRETPSQIRKLQGQGVLGVEMETSALCSVAEFRGAKAGSLTRVSDSLANFKWEPYFWNNKKYLKSHKETSVKIIIEALKQL